MVSQAVILAAGRGVRLRPLTENVPKVMVRIGDKPVVEYIIDKLKKLDVVDITLVVNYKKEKIKKYFGNSVKYCVQKKPLGTANAVYAAKNFLDNEEFILVYGDIFFENDLSEFIKDKPISIVVCHVKDASRFGRIVIKENKIIDIVEKDGVKTPGFINAGIFLFDDRIFDAIEKTRVSSRGEYELTDSIKILIKKGVKLKPYYLKGYWSDIGKISDLENVKRMLKNSLKKHDKSRDKN